MKPCPVCRIPLTFVDYEGLRVMTCADCGGHLLKLERLQAIQRLDHEPSEQLKEEAAEFNGDVAGTIRCPGCMLPMRKQTLHRAASQFNMDVLYALPMGLARPG